MPSSLLDTFARLCIRDNRRTEAEIQADVRQFILDAPFELEEDDLSLVGVMRESVPNRTLSK
jgi:hypothetical protein